MNALFCHLVVLDSSESNKGSIVRRMSVMLDDDQLDILRAAAELQDKRAGRLLSESVDAMIRVYGREQDVKDLLRSQRLERSGLHLCP